MSRICVSIAAHDLEQLKRQINQAFNYGADYVEIRFDFLNLSDMDQAMSISNMISKKAVYTVRAPDEGGHFKGSIAQRIAWLKKLAASKPMLLDVELNTIKYNTCLTDYLKAQNVSLLISWHDFEKTPQDAELKRLLYEMRTYSQNIKMVATAQTTVDSLRLLDLYENARELNLIAFAMGDAGVISRVLCVIIGNAPFTYASLEKAISPGQLTIKQMRKLYDRINDQLNQTTNAKPS
ncbi:MAG TPA: type I 3-dehydroquinate dehydratase [Nitrososphaeraceae archaeon]|nr:type I 3-dehydroquinate dehydratase [Nitrososphaeraceae archaeon]